MRIAPLTTAGIVALVPLLSAGQAPAVDPCALVSRVDVEQIVGKLEADPKAQLVERAKMCSYEFASDGHSLEIWVFPASGLDRARKLRKGLEPVTDLGYEALLGRNASIGWIELYTRKGDVTLEVTMEAGAGAEDKVKAVARKALARM